MLTRSHRFRWTHILGCAVLLGLVLAVMGQTFAAADEAAATGAAGGQWKFALVWFICLAGSIAALVQAYLFYKWVLNSDPGNERMIEIASYVRQGANAYLKQQYIVVACFFVVIVMLLAVAAFGLKVQSKFVPFAFLTGGFFSGLAGWIGMRTATMASNRTTEGARQSLNQGLQVAFRAGAVMGLTVVGLGLLDITLWFGFLYWIWPLLGFGDLTLVEITVTMLCFGMGASSQALFARVGGGIFTKAADVVPTSWARSKRAFRKTTLAIRPPLPTTWETMSAMWQAWEPTCTNPIAVRFSPHARWAWPPSPRRSSMAPLAWTVSAPSCRRCFCRWRFPGQVSSCRSWACTWCGRRKVPRRRICSKLWVRGINASCGLIVIASIVLSMWLMPQVPGTMIGPIPGVAMSVIVGLLAGWLIGKWTEYSTSDEFAPTRALADQTSTGPATLIIGGIADGMLSVWVPVMVVCVSTMMAFGFATGWRFNDVDLFALGLYGVGIAAVGMLSTLGITLATDAYGPVADNAGGNAEMSGLDPEVRKRTDALDSLGNTTAATGKGFAIGSAALTALALVAAYVEEVRVGFERWGAEIAVTLEDDGFYKASPGFVIHKKGDTVKTYLLMPADRRHEKVQTIWNAIAFSPKPGLTGTHFIRLDKDGHPELELTGARLVSVHEATLPDFTTYYDASLMNPKVLVGVFLGAMATFVFCGATMKAVGRAAKGMVEEVRRQFKEKPGIMDGTQKPDYAAPVAISTKAAQREMILPSLLALLLPVVTGLVLGVGGVMGLLVGTLTTGFCLAVFMANAGGSWDNAKKYIEGGRLGGKGSDAHKAAVVGDTVGDPFKDTSGPSLNILIKLMSMVSVVAAGLVVRVQPDRDGYPVTQTVSSGFHAAGKAGFRRLRHGAQWADSPPGVNGHRSEAFPA